MIRDIDHLDQLAALDNEDSGEQLNMDFWVPSEEVAVYEVDLPEVPLRKQLEMLPWILEDQMLRPVEELHFSIAKKISDKRALVYVVAKDVMHRWLMMAESKSVAVQQLTPDFLALPLEGDYWTINVQGSRMIARTGEYSGFAAEVSLGWQLLELELKKFEDVRVAAIVEDEDLIPEQWRDRIQAQVGSLNWGFLDLPDVNLLTGEFKKSPPKQFTPWLPSMAVGALAVLLAVVYMLVQSYQWQKQLVVIDQGIANAYRTLYGETWRGSREDVKLVAESRKRLLEHQYFSLQKSPLTQLRSIDAALSSCGNCALQTVAQNTNTVSFTLTPSQALRGRLSNVSGVKLDWGEPNSDGVVVLKATAVGDDG